MPANPKTPSNQDITGNNLAEAVRLLGIISGQLHDISEQVGTVAAIAGRAEKAAGEFLPAARQFISTRRGRLMSQWANRT